MKKQFLFFIITLIFNLNANLDPINTQIPRLMKFSSVAYSQWQTIFNTYQLAVNCIANNIEGDFVECGVGAGAQIAAMAYAAEKLNKKVTIHLFDSFEGIPLAGPNDTLQPGVNGEIIHNRDVENPEELLISSSYFYPNHDVAVHSEEAVKNHLINLGINKFENLIFHKGWFQYTLPTDAPQIKKISLLRLDADLYESTKICLEYFYPKISKGGFMIIDDYSLDGCRKAVHEYVEKNNLKPLILPIVPFEKDMGPVFWQVN